MENKSSAGRDEGQLIVELHGLYSSALPLARKLSVDTEFNEESQVELLRFQELIEQARQLDQPMRDFAARRIHDGTLAKDTRAMTTELADLIRELISLCDQIERKVVHRRNLLLPQMSQQLKIRKMQNAYQNTRSA